MAFTALMSLEQVSIGALAPLVGYHLRRAGGAFAADFAVAMDKTSLRQVTVAALSVVDANPGISQGAVGRALGIKRANMVSLINELVDKGLIDRAVVPTDRRTFSLNITADGSAAMTDAVKRITEHERLMLADMSIEEQATLLDLLTRIERRSPSSEAEENGEG